MIRFTAEVAGDQVLSRAFNRVDEQISDFRFVWPSVAGEIYQITNEQFESEGASGASGQWAGLSAAYARFKAAEFPGQTILKAEEDMFNSLTDPEAPDAIYRPLKDELIIGSRDPKALAHHKGKGRLPARPIYSFTEAHKRRMQKAIQRELAALTRRAGFEVREEAA